MTGVFHLIADLKSGADMAEVERVIDEELDRVRREPISKREFDRAVTAVQASFVWGLERLRARAGTLQEYNHYVGDPDYIGRDLLRFRKTTGDAVRDAAARYLGTRVEIITAPQGGN
jgi:zinc protease